MQFIPFVTEANAKYTRVVSCLHNLNERDTHPTDRNTTESANSFFMALFSDVGE
jgi:hypothetical protein